MAEGPKSSPNSSNTQGGNNQVAAESTPARRRRSGMFTNLQSYLQANRPQAQRIPERFGKETERTATKALTDLEKQREKTLGEVREGSTTQEQYDLGKQATKKFTSFLPSNTGAVNQGTTGLAGPQTFGLEDSETEAIQRLRQGYTGPSQQTIQRENRFQNALGLAEKAEDIARRTESAEGRQGLLREFYGRPGYTGGEQFLDQLLIGTDQPSRQALSQLRQRFLQDEIPTQKIEQGRELVMSQVGSLVGQAEGFKTDIESDLEKSRTDISSALESRRAQAQQDLNQKIREINTKLTGILPTGVEGQPQSILGVNLQDFITDASGKVIGGMPELGLGDVLTERDVEIANVLSGLRGTNQPLVTADMINPDRIDTSTLGVNVDQIRNQMMQNRDSILRDIENLKPDAQNINANSFYAGDFRGLPGREQQQALEEVALQAAQIDKQIGSGEAAAQIENIIKAGRSNLELVRDVVEAAARAGRGLPQNLDPDRIGFLQFLQTRARGDWRDLRSFPPAAFKKEVIDDTLKPMIENAIRVGDKRGEKILRGDLELAKKLYKGQVYRKWLHDTVKGDISAPFRQTYSNDYIMKNIQNIMNAVPVTGAPGTYQPAGGTRRTPGLVGG